MTDPIEQLFETIIETIQSDSQAPEELATAVCNAIVAKSELVEVLKTDRRMVQINQGNASGYQVLVEDGVAYIGTHYQIDGNTLKSLLEVVVRRVFQPPVGIPQNLPHRGAPKFVGRDRELATLHEQLQQNDRLAIASVQGMGGVGKTELALQYGLKHLPLGTYPGGVCWLRSREDVGSQIVEFARRQLSLEPPEEFELVGRVEYCWRHWQAGDVLAIFDDVQNYEDIQPYFPPVESRFKVLMTTRSRMGASVRELELDVLSKDAALDLLREIVGIDRIESQLADAEALCEWLGYLPLGLELVGRYLARNQTLTLVKMHQRLNEKRLAAKGLIKHDVGMTTTHVSLAAAFEVSWEDLGNKSVLAKSTGECARQLGALLSLFAVAPIDWNWVLACLPECDEEDLEAARDEGLIDAHLLQVNGDNTYQLHPLIKEFLMVKCDEIYVDYKFQQSVRFVVLTEAQKSRSKPEKSLTVECALVIPHLQELIKDSQNVEAKEEEALCLLWLAHLYYSMGRHNDAESPYKQSLAIREDKLGANHPDTATSLNNLALLYHSMGKYSQVESLLLRSLLILENQLGSDSTVTATNINNLAEFYKTLGKYDEAESLYKRSIVIYEKYGSNHQDAIQCFNNLAHLYELLAKYDDAKVLYNKVILLCETQYGLNHPITAQCINNLACLYESIGNYNDAEVLYQQSMEIREQQLGARHPDTATSINNLAELYRVTGRSDRAETLHLRSLEIREHQLGLDHPDTASSLNNLALLYQSVGRLSESEPLFLKALEIRKQQLGIDHIQTASSLNNLAAFYQLTGRYFEAEPLLLQSLGIYEQRLGLKHPTTAISLNNLAALYGEIEKYIEAETLYLRSLAIIEQQLGADHPNTQNIIKNLKLLREKIDNLK